MLIPRMERQQRIKVHRKILKSQVKNDQNPSFITWQTSFGSKIEIRTINNK